MPYGELRINNQDAYTQYHLNLEDGGVAQLMTPAPMKDRAKNKSRMRHGEEAAGSLEKKDSRSLSLPFSITARTNAEGLQYYNALCQALDAGEIVLWSKYTPNEYYRLHYMSCTSFTNFYTSMFKFTLKFEEYNPANRAIPVEYIE